MATGHTRESISVYLLNNNSEEEVRRHLWSLRLQPSNKFCADCESDDSGWVNVTIGCFLCVNCAGVHRSFGVKQAVVKSLTMDHFNSEWIKRMEECGNLRVNTKFERHLGEYRKYRKPVADSTYQEREKFIRAKYIEKLFMKPPNITEIDPRHGDLLKEAMPLRLVDYFIVVGRGNPIEIIGGASTTDDESPAVTDVLYEPIMIEQYPRTSWSDAELSPNLPLFTFPSYIQLYEKPPDVTCYPFVLTKMNGAKQYGMCLRFYEKLDALEIVHLTSEVEKWSTNTNGTTAATSPSRKSSTSTSLERRPSQLYGLNVYSPKVLCVTSHWNFFDLYRNFLKILYRIFLSAPPMPLERFISNFMYEIPVPPAGVTKVIYTLADTSIPIYRSPPNILPRIDLSFELLFENLTHENIVAIALALITEQKVVFTCSSLTLLTTISECCVALLFPFHWQGVYMPLLPLKLADFLHAPVPFVAGFHSKYKDHFDIPNEVVYVDIDNNDVFLPSKDTLPSIPDRDRQKLLKRLKTNANIYKGGRSVSLHTSDIAYTNGEHLQPVQTFASSSGIQIKRDVSVDVTPKSNKKFNEHEVRDGFLRLWTKLFMRYREYINVEHALKSAKQQQQQQDEGSQHHIEMLFHEHAFINDAPFEARPLLKAILETQLWAFFVGERIHSIQNPSDQSDYSVKFFDECIIAKQNRAAPSKLLGKKTTPFLDDHSKEITNTFVVAPPDTSELKVARYHYERWPRLQDDLFGQPRYVKPLITAQSVFQRTQLSTQLSKMSHVLMISTQHARKDWCATISAVVLIQSSTRGYFARRNYRRMRDAARLVVSRIQTRKAYSQLCRLRACCTTIQSIMRVKLHHRRFIRIRTACETLQTYMQTLICMNNVRVKIKAIVKIQRTWRSYCKCRHIRKAFLIKRYKICVIQSYVRTYLRIRSLHRVKDATLTLQAYVHSVVSQREYKQRLLYAVWLMDRLRTIQTQTQLKHKIQCVTLSQAILRGHLVRRDERRKLLSEIHDIRHRLLHLWHLLAIPLLHRSQFWLLFHENQATFLSLIMHRDELQRMEDMKRDHNNHNEHSKRVEAMTTERQVLYKVLKKRLSDDDKADMFRSVGVDTSGKKRKQRLLDSILWRYDGDDRLSVHTTHANIVIRILNASDDVDINATNIVRLKGDRIRDNVLFTLHASLQSLMKARKNEMRWKKQHQRQAFEVHDLKQRIVSFYGIKDRSTSRGASILQTYMRHPSISMNHRTNNELILPPLKVESNRRRLSSSSSTGATTTTKKT